LRARVSAVERPRRRLGIKLRWSTAFTVSGEGRRRVRLPIVKFRYRSRGVKISSPRRMEQYMGDRWLKLFLGKLALAALAVAAFTVMAGVPKLHADDDCQRRVAHADHRLHEAIEHYGYQSREAAEARHELHEEREHCWKANNRWWDEDRRRWHDQRDWDDRDHDENYRPRDRDDDRR